MGIEMPMEEWKKPTADFHPDPSKLEDPVEKVIDRTGDLEAAFDEISVALEKDPNNPELRRQANLLINRAEDLAGRLRDSAH